MIQEELKSLGWEFEDYLNNRAIYSIGSYHIFEHQGNIGILVADDFIYCDMTNKELTRYTQLAKDAKEMYNNPDKYTFAQGVAKLKEVIHFIQTMKEK